MDSGPLVIYVLDWCKCDLNSHNVSVVTSIWSGYMLVTRIAKIQWKLGGDDDDVIRATFNFSNTLCDDNVLCSSCTYIYTILYCTFSCIWIDLKHINDEWKIIWNEWIAKASTRKRKNRKNNNISDTFYIYMGTKTERKWLIFLFQ